MMDWNHSWSAGNWAVMGLMMVVLWSLIAVAVVAVVRASRGRAQTPPAAAHADPGQILDQRLARGEITEDEYAHSRALLHLG